MEWCIGNDGTERLSYGHQTEKRLSAPRNMEARRFWKMLRILRKRPVSWKRSTTGVAGLRGHMAQAASVSRTENSVRYAAPRNHEFVNKKDIMQILLFKFYY